MRGAQTVHDVDTRAVGQLQVNEDDIGAHEVGATHRVRNGPSLSDNLEGLVSINDLSNAASDDLVIVDDHDARTRSGIFTHVSDSNGQEGERPRLLLFTAPETGGSSHPARPRSPRASSTRPVRNRSHPNARRRRLAP